MSGLIRLLILLVLVLAAPLDSHSEEPPHVPGEIIVKLASHAHMPEVEAMLERNGCVMEEMVDSLGLMLVSYNDGSSAAEVSNAIAAESNIEFAHPNYLVEGGFVPSDRHFSKQWHHNKQ